MDLDQSALLVAVSSGLIVFASIVISSLMCTWINSKTCKAATLKKTENWFSRAMILLLNAGLKYCRI